MSDTGPLDWSGLIEWLFVIEVVLLLTAGVFWLISLPMRKNSPDDPICRFVSVFWKVLLRRRVGVSAAVAAFDMETSRRYESLKASGDTEGLKELLAEQNEGQEFDDTDVNAIVAQARSERGPASEAATEAPPPNTIILSITVIPFSPQDKLVSVKGDQVTIQCTQGPEEGGVNKIVIDLLMAMLDVKAYQVNLTKGHYRANKVVQVAGIDTATFRQKSAKWA